MSLQAVFSMSQTLISRVVNKNHGELGFSGRLSTKIVSVDLISVPQTRNCCGL